MYEKFNNLIEPIKIDANIIHIYFKNTDYSFKEYIDSIEFNKEIYLLNNEIDDQVLLVANISNNIKINIYAKNEKIYLRKINIDLIEDDNSYDINIVNRSKRIFVEKRGVSTLLVKDKVGSILLCIDDFLTSKPINKTIEYNWNYKFRKRFFVFSKVNYGIYNLIFTYDFENKEFNVYKIIFNTLLKNENIEVNIENRNDISIFNTIIQTKNIVKIKNMKNGNWVQLYDGKPFKEFEGKNIISIYVINKSRYYIYQMKKGIFIGKSNGEKITGPKIKLKCFAGRKNYYIYGQMVHYGYNALGKYENLYLRGSQNKIGKFKRPFKNLKYLKRFGYFKISYEDLDKLKLIHNNLLIGNEEFFIHNLFFKKNDDKVKTYKYKKVDNNLFITRTNLQGNITSTIIPYSKEYSAVSKIKINFAKRISKILKNKKINLNLYFEKKANKADESAIRVFEKVIQKERKNSKNYFIIDKDSPEYNKLKEKYGDKIVKKYSFRHYLYIFNADNFISSELSNHVLNDRLFIDSLRNRIMEVPLVFLQHGIMFAKPVDNPMAFGFHKDKNNYNINKTVISSELEAGEFYKMKYSRDDLILTGLATFDYAKLDKGADKIAYMPTYRYWEEGLIYSGKVDQTTYYDSIMKIISAFEKEGLIDRLLIVPHNKFSEYIYNNLQQYKSIISNNPSEALKKANVFITDYSSAIYDAQFRGAYPIFYWEERDYLIDQYKAIPPINENNACGPVAFSIESLIKEVKLSIKNNYKLDEKYRKNYLNINKFNDRRNTDRIIEFLEKELII